ncbi:unnamed protein product [Urochloa humidicola]
MAERGRRGRGCSAGRRDAALSVSPERRGTTYVVTKTVRDMGGAQYPILTRSNYAEWEVVVKVMMKACGLRKAAIIGADNEQEDQMAMEAILKAVPSEFAITLGTKKTTKEAWETLTTMRLGNDRVRKARAQQLRRDYEALTFNDGETVEDFALRLSTMVSQLASLGDIISEPTAQIALSIETMLDKDILTIEEVMGWLKAVEDRLKEAPALTTAPLRTRSSGRRVGGSPKQGKVPWFHTEAAEADVVAEQEAAEKAAEADAAGAAAAAAEDASGRTSASTAAKQGTGSATARSLYTNTKVE